MKKEKIIFIFTILLLFLIIPVNTYAATTDDINDVVKNMKGVNQVNIQQGNSISNAINSVIKLIQIVGSGIAVIVVTMLGVKYMIASTNEKADVKKQAVPIVIGCVLLFAAVNIAGIIADFGNSLN